MELGPGLPDFIHQGVAKAPCAGQGVHGFLYWLALKLHPYRSVDQIRAILREFGDNCGRCVPNQEVEDAIRNSAPFAWRAHSNNGVHNSTGSQQQRSTQAPSRIPPCPPAEPEVIADICRDGPSLSELREISPRPCNPSSPTAQEAIELLFPGSPWLCCGRSVQVFETRRRVDWQDSLADQSLIVPSAMLGRYGFTKDGKVSEHAQSAVGPRQYLVVECDFAERSRDATQDTALAPLIHQLAKDGISVSDMCAAVLSFAGQFAPLAMVVHSANKSLHAWFPCSDIDEAILREFFSQCGRLGADPRMWLKSQFARLPGGIRYPKTPGQSPRRQEIIYFNPEALAL